MIKTLRQISLSLFRDSELLFLLIASFLILLVSLAVFSRIKDRAAPEDAEPFPHLPFLKRSRRGVFLSRGDMCFLTAVMAIYSLVSFHQLGAFTMPVTTWQPSSSPQEIILHLPQASSFDRLITFYGEGDNNSRESGYQLGFHNIAVEGSSDRVSWYPITVLNEGSIYRFNIAYGLWDYPYIRITSTDDADTLSEIAFASGDTLLKVEVEEDAQANSAYPAALLIDEQDRVALDPTYYDESFFDEIYHPRNAWEIANGQFMYSTVHPLLGTELMALSIRLLGNCPFAWRLPGALIGIAILPLVYVLLYRLLFDSRYARFGTVLAACEFMHITTSRIATLEPISVFLILFMYERMVAWCNISWWDQPFRKSVSTLFSAGLVMSLGFSAKWTACYSAVGLALMFFVTLFQRFGEYRRAKSVDPETLLSLSEAEQLAYRRAMHFPDLAAKTILWAVLFFVGLPLIIYALVYIPAPFSRTGYSLQAVADQTAYIYNYHTNLEATHPYQSTWTQWMLDARPIWYFGRLDRQSVYHTITCFTNPLTTWTALAAIPATLIAFLRKRSFAPFVILAGFFSALCPWMLVNRCVFAYHFYPSCMFEILAVTYGAMLVERRFPKAAWVRHAYLFASIAVFVIFLPVLTGFGTTQDYVTFLEFLPLWQLG